MLGSEGPALTAAVPAWDEAPPALTAPRESEPSVPKELSARSKLPASLLLALLLGAAVAVVDVAGTPGAVEPVPGA